jgi:tetratricopeptide (TPR) repeat protein
VLLGTLGSGGMGVVISAHDPQLNRKVALKLLRPDLQSEDRAHWTERLTREAQAMAQLAHPNVVTVYETVDLGEQLAIVMELVDGKNLRAWMSEHDDWREVLAMVMAAGRGLAAAHAVGLVHRDFKPDNVLVGADGRARVTDFGLVTSGVRVETADLSSGARVDAVLSVTGNIVGTPAYMAPEQWDGGKIDARTDQFAFCATAWEALYRERPFDARSVREQRAALAKPIARPAAGRAPRWIEPILRRGLSPRPEDRWPSMTALLHALDPARRRRTPILVGAALVVTAGAAATVAWVVASKDPAACPDPKRRLAGVWDDTVKGKLAAQFTGLGKKFATDVWAVDAPKLDAYANAWSAMSAASCKATRIERTQNETVMDVRGRCLDRRLAALGALTGMLATADVDTAVKLPDLIDGLPSIEDCADIERLTAYPLPAGGAARKAIAEVEAEHDRARNLRMSGDFKGSVVAIDAAIERARQVDHPPLLLEALMAGGRYHESAGKSDEGARMLREAIQVAARAKDDHGAALAWALLVQLLAGHPATVAESASIEQAAVAAAVRVGQSPEVQHRLLLARAQLAMAQRNTKGALEHLQAAAGLDGITEHDRREALESVAKLLYMTGRPKEALTIAEQVLEISRKLVGPQHPLVGDNLALMGQIQGGLGLDDAAEASALQALDIRRAVYGEQHRMVAHSLQTLANIAARRGDVPKAQELIGQAIAIHEKLEDRSGLGSAIGMLARYSANAGDLKAALGHYRRAMKAFEDTDDVGGIEYFEMAQNLASMYADQGDCASAMPLFEKVRTGFENLAPPKAPLPMIGLASCQEQVGDKTAALATYERAYALCKQTDCGPAGTFLSAWAIAQLLVTTGGDRKRARELALEGRALLVEEGASEDDLKQVDAWLKKH